LKNRYLFIFLKAGYSWQKFCLWVIISYRSQNETTLTPWWEVGDLEGSRLRLKPILWGFPMPGAPWPIINFC